MPRWISPALAALALCTATCGDEPTPAATSFETVLNGKGLKRSGLSYILADTDSRDRRLGEFTEMKRRLAGVYSGVLSEKARLEAEERKARKDVSNAESRLRNADRGSKKDKDDDGKGREYDSAKRHLSSAEGDLSSAKSALSRFMMQHQSQFDQYELGKQGIEDLRTKLIQETEALYAKLSLDPEVKAAIRAHNREHRPKVVLGPFASEQEYRAIILKDDLDILGEKGVSYRKDRKQIVLIAEERVVTLAFEAQKHYDGLKAAESQATQKKPSRRDELIAKRLKVTALLAASSEIQKPRYKAELAELNRQIEQATTKEGALDPEGETPSQKVTQARKLFLASLQQIRDAAAAAGESRRTAPEDVEIRDALAEVLGHKPKIADSVEYRRALDSLARFEKLVRVERIPQRLGPAGRPVVTAILNGVKPIEMTLDSRVRITLVPASLAADLGLAPGPGATNVELPGDGGPTIRAKRAVLPQVRLGPFTIEKVACLILPPDAPAALSPVLGAEILDHFASRITSGAELVLVEISVPAPRPPVAPRR
jgi:hypothetical protein